MKNIEDDIYSLLFSIRRSTNLEAFRLDHRYLYNITDDLTNPLEDITYNVWSSIRRTHKYNINNSNIDSIDNNNNIQLK